MNTLVIDTSFGSTVGVVGHEPIVETDSRLHVERVQVNIARALQEAQLSIHDIARIIVGVGPAPFTGLRVGIIAAQALAFATGAELIGQDIISVQAYGLCQLRGGAQQNETDHAQHDQQTEHMPSTAARQFTLAVNDARRKQLYYVLYDTTSAADMRARIAMNIDNPDRIVSQVNELLASEQKPVKLSIMGHGAQHYAQVWQALEMPYELIEPPLLSRGKQGLALFAQCALATGGSAVRPLYLRRPDVSVPHPLKSALQAEQPVSELRA